MTRFFIPGNLHRDTETTLSEQDTHRVARVLRMQVGDELTLCDDGGQVFRATLTALTPLARARPFEREPQPPVPQITLAQCLPKAAKMDFVVEKAIEAGAARIIPVQSARVITERGGHAGKIERWRRLARSASEQSAAPQLAQITEPCDWTALLATFGDYDCVLIAWEGAPPSSRKLRNLPTLATARLLVVIGPEGGLSVAEIAAAEACGAHVFTLGTRILRTETAGAVAIGIVRYVLETQIDG